MPWRIRARVSSYILLASSLLILPWIFLLRFSLLSRLATSLTLLLVELYILWCFWPKFSWGIPRQLLGKLNSPRTQKFHLSFDDGPTPGVTDKILDILNAHRMKASFFILTNKGRACPELIRRMVAEGHEIGLHGENHRSPFFRSRLEIAGSLKNAKQELELLTGTPIHLYRPSHGWKNYSLLQAVRDSRLQLMMWDFGIWDTAAPAPEVLLARLRLINNAYSETSSSRRRIILLHDGRNDDPSIPAHASSMTQALDAWLNDLSASLPTASKPSVRLIQWLGLVIGGLVIAAVLWNIDASKLWRATRQLPFPALASAFALNLASNAFQGLRFYFLWPQKGISALKQMGLQFCLNASNILLPFRTGEAVRPLILKRWNPELTLPDLVFWTAADKVLEVVTFLPFLIAATFLCRFSNSSVNSTLTSTSTPWFGQGSRSASWMLPIVGILLAAGGMIMWGRRSRRERPRAPIRAVLSSLFMWCGNWLAFYVLLLSLPISLGVLSVTTFSSIIPLTPAGFATFEASFTWFVQSFGNLTAESALALALASHFMAILSTLLVGLPLLLIWGWPKRHQEALSRVKVPLKYKISNVFVYIIGFLMILTSLAIWIPNSRMPKKFKDRKNRNTEADKSGGLTE